jgi:hypothetical protein
MTRLAALALPLCLAATAAMGQQLTTTPSPPLPSGGLSSGTKPAFDPIAKPGDVCIVTEEKTVLCGASPFIHGNTEVSASSTSAPVIRGPRYGAQPPTSAGAPIMQGPIYETQSTKPSQQLPMWSIPGTTLLACDGNMPCGDKANKEDLKQAYEYCRKDFYTPHYGVENCTPVLMECDSSSDYSVPACDGIVRRWESSLWKKDDDAAATAEKKQRLERARAFIEAVGKQK